jgi:hypothetical protein
MKRDAIKKADELEEIFSKIHAKKFKMGRPNTQHINRVVISEERIEEIERTYIAPYFLFLKERQSNFPNFLENEFNISRENNLPVFIEITKVFRRVQVRKAQGKNREKMRKIRKGELPPMPSRSKQEEYRVVEPQKPETLLTLSDLI